MSKRSHWVQDSQSMHSNAGAFARRWIMDRAGRTVSPVDEERFQSERRLEQDQLWHKALKFIDCHRRRNIAALQVGTPALVFSTCSGLMPGKLKLRWLGPFWITNSHAGTFGTLDGQILPTWVNDFWFKTYNGMMPPNPFIRNHPLYRRERKKRGENRKYTKESEETNTLTILNKTPTHSYIPTKGAYIYIQG